MRKSRYLAGFAAIILLGAGCGATGSLSLPGQSAETFADCSKKEYKSVRDFEDDKSCADIVEDQIRQECDKDTYISRQERVQRLVRAACQEALAVSSSRDQQEAELKDISVEEFLESRLGDETLLEGNIITEIAAVEEVRNSNIYNTLIRDYPGLAGNAEFYTTREVKKLAESDLWFPVTDSIAQFDQDNLNEPVWQVLITCLANGCDRTQFLKAINADIPVSIDEGMSEEDSDLIFVVHARTGDLIMYERGSGQRGDAIAFMAQWLEFSE